jgi:hypothetical protein
MTYVFNPANGEITNIASATASVTNSRRDSYSMAEPQKKQYAKAVKYAKKKKTFLDGVFSSITVANTFPTLNLKGEPPEDGADRKEDKPCLVIIF